MPDPLVLLLLAGIVDPNHRLGPLARPGDGDQPRVLSPFDEAALETALRLRETAPELRIAALVTGGPESDGLVRTVCAYRPDTLFRLDCPPQQLWNPAALAQHFPAILGALDGAPALVLMGREFGDCDDGTLPAFLAEACDLRFVGLVERIGWQQGRLVAERVRATGEERLVLPPPVLASVTNAKSNRLRRPLLKNVMLARREPVAVLALATGSGAAAGPVALVSLRPATPPARTAGACRMLEGPPQAQAAELARALIAVRNSRR